MKKKRYKIELSDEAESDFDKSYEYYSYKNEKVANDFFKNVNNSLEEIAKNPSTYPKVINEVRKYVIKKFPFIIYYKIEQLIIKIIAIFHANRNPEIWKDRTENNEE